MSLSPTLEDGIITIQITRPTVAVVQFGGRTTFTVTDTGGTYTLLGNHDDAGLRCRRFIRWFDKSAKLIESGESRPHYIMETVRQHFSYRPHPKVNPSSWADPS
jgi:hypothetical protein